MNVAPDTVRPDAARPEKPDRLLLTLRVNVPDVVNRPDPERVPPASVMLPPLLASGAAPRGSVQPLFTVLTRAVCVKLTALKVTPLQVSVPAVAPVKLNMPPLAANVGVPEMVKDPDIDVIAVDAVNDPPVRVKAVDVNAELPALNVPAVCEYAADTVSDRLWVIVPVYPPFTLMLETVPAKDASTTAAFVDVASKTTDDAAVGHVDAAQLLQSDQLLVAPAPIQVPVPAIFTVCVTVLDVEAPNAAAPEYAPEIGCDPEDG